MTVVSSLWHSSETRFVESLVLSINKDGKPLNSCTVSSFGDVGAVCEDSPWISVGVRASVGVGLEREGMEARRGKLRRALHPRILRAAASYAVAASSAVSNVPSQTRAPCLAESRISAANLPQGRCLTPR